MNKIYDEQGNEIKQKAPRSAADVKEQAEITRFLLAGTGAAVIAYMLVHAVASLFSFLFFSVSEE